MTTVGIFLFHQILLIIFPTLILYTSNSRTWKVLHKTRQKNRAQKSLSQEPPGSITTATQPLVWQIFVTLSTGIDHHRPSYFFGLNLPLHLRFPLPEIIFCPTELGKNVHVGFQGCFGPAVSRLDLPLYLRSLLKRTLW